MTKTPKTDALIASLTLEQAREFCKQADALCWIEYTLLDPAGIGRKQAERVEEALLTLIEDHAIETFNIEMSNSVEDDDRKKAMANLAQYVGVSKAKQMRDAWMIQFRQACREARQ